MPLESQKPSPNALDEKRLVRMVKEFRDEAYDARRTRIELNRRNFDALHGRMDWSHKIEGQTTEFLPKTGVALEQFAAMVEESITGAKDWYLPVMGRSRRFPLSDVQARSLLTALLDNTALNASESGPIQRVIVDGIKLGALGSLAIFKVHVALQYKHDDGGYGQEQPEMPMQGMMPPQPGGEFGPSEFFEGEQAGPNVARETIRPEGLPGRPTFRLRVETIRQEDFYPDPTGRGLYEIHRSERDFYTVDWMAKEGVYDMEAVKGLKSWYEQERQQRANAEKGQNQTNSPSTRRIVTIDEYWGDILDDDGRCVMKNCFFAIANEQFIIRKPAPNPFWHNRSPFVRVPILRVPNSVWHRALFDGPVEMNLTMNELYSLMVDGAIGSVWGTRQLRIDDLENPEEVSAGVPQGKTLQVKSSLPPGVKVMEDLTNGKIPPEALAMFELVNREFSSGAMSNELRLGSMPERSVKATEIVASEQSVGNLTRAIAKHIELGIGEILHLCWMNVMQHMEMIEPDLFTDPVGPPRRSPAVRTPAVAPSRCSPTRRQAA